ncbi:MAG: hypothetical protein H6627_06475 [Calditrichae bacterium]|nr:hypothetical protein [Calditrichia bacterium]
MIYLNKKKYIIIFSIMLLSVSAFAQTVSFSSLQCEETQCCSMKEMACCKKEMPAEKKCGCPEMDQMQNHKTQSDEAVPADNPNVKLVYFISQPISDLSVETEQINPSEYFNIKRSDLTDTKIYKTIHSFLI